MRRKHRLLHVHPGNLCSARRQTGLAGISNLPCLFDPSWCDVFFGRRTGGSVCLFRSLEATLQLCTMSVPVSFGPCTLLLCAQFVACLHGCCIRSTHLPPNVQTRVWYCSDNPGFPLGEIAVGDNGQTEPFFARSSNPWMQHHCDLLDRYVAGCSICLRSSLVLGRCKSCGKSQQYTFQPDTDAQWPLCSLGNPLSNPDAQCANVTADNPVNRLCCGFCILNNAHMMRMWNCTGLTELVGNDFAIDVLPPKKNTHNFNPLSPFPSFRLPSLRSLYRNLCSMQCRGSGCSLGHLPCLVTGPGALLPSDAAVCGRAAVSWRPSCHGRSEGARTRNTRWEAITNHKPQSHNLSLKHNPTYRETLDPRPCTLKPQIDLALMHALLEPLLSTSRGHLRRLWPDKRADCEFHDGGPCQVLFDPASYAVECDQLDSGCDPLTSRSDPVHATPCLKAK